MKVLDPLRQDIQAHKDKKYKESSKRFFKVEVLSYGVKIPLVRQIAQTHFRRLENPTKL